MKQFYKVARPDGFDFHTNTINYRTNIGKTITNPNKTESKELCTADLIHASEFFFDALYYGDLPCSIFLVEGIPVSKQSDKAGFKELKIVKEIPTANWQNAFYSLVIWMLKDLKNNFDCKIHKKATDAVNQAIQVFVNAQKTGKIDVSAAESIEATARSAGFALSVGATARSARFADLSVEYAILSVEYALSALSARSATSAEYAAWSAEYAAWSAEYAALSARSATLSVEYTARSAEAAKKKELSDKFIGLLEE